MSTDAAFQKRIEAQQQKRHQEAQACLQIAEICLDKLIKCNFSVPDLAVHAYRYLLKGLKLNRSNPRFYCQLAFLVALYRRRDLALHYLEQALTLDPDNSEALRLQARLQQPLAERSAELDFASEPELSLLQSEPEQELELNFLQHPVFSAAEARQIYADLIQALPELLLQVQADADHWKLSLIPTVVEQHREKAEQLQRQLAELEAQMNQIQHFQPVSELQQMLSDLQALSERLASYSQCSQVALSLRDQITDLIKEARQLQQDKSQQIAVELELTLDALFTRYEAIADQMESLELKTQDITALERYFSPLSRLLENLQKA